MSDEFNNSVHTSKSLSLNLKKFEEMSAPISGLEITVFHSSPKSNISYLEMNTIVMLKCAKRFKQL